jgi:hypothetical protein
MSLNGVVWWIRDRAARLSALPCLNTFPDSRAINCEGRRSNGLPDRPHKHDVLEIHEAGLFEAEWLRPLAQVQKGRKSPLFDAVFTRQDETIQGIGRFYATDGQVANTGETPSSGKVQYSGPLFESTFL